MKEAMVNIISVVSLEVEYDCHDHPVETKEEYQSIGNHFFHCITFESLTLSPKLSGIDVKVRVWVQVSVK